MRKNKKVLTAVILGASLLLDTFISTVLRYYFDDNSHVFIGFETEDGKTKMTNLSMSYSY